MGRRGARGGSRPPSSGRRAEEGRRPAPAASERVRAPGGSPSPGTSPSRGARRRGRAPRSPSPSAPILVETVFFQLYDVGRGVDLAKVASYLPAHPDLGIAKRRDTPASLTLPTPLVIELGEPECTDLGGLECLSSQAKIYAEGVVTMVLRVKSRLPLRTLHSLRELRVTYQDRSLDLVELSEEHFTRIFETLKPAVADPHSLAEMDRESYVAYCLRESGEDPARFIERNSDYCAALLIGEEPGAGLHESQVRATLATPFSYRDDDLAIFDLDRCLIIDPRGDYEDLLLIAEHANYQLLELRVLDKLLDSWLDEAEDDIRRLSSGVSGSRRRGLSGLRDRAEAKVAHIQAVSLDALFILENLENSSKIIGDYYLGQVYAKLCAIFNTEGWKWSVERRLDSLHDVYDMVKTDAAEKRMVALEITFIFVCIFFPIIQIIQVMIGK